MFSSLIFSDSFFSCSLSSSSRFSSSPIKISMVFCVFAFCIAPINLTMLAVIIDTTSMPYSVIMTVIILPIGVTGVKSP